MAELNSSNHSQSVMLIEGKLYLRDDMGRLTLAKEGEELPYGQTLVTGADGFAKLQMPDGGMFEIGANRELKFDADFASIAAADQSEATVASAQTLSDQILAALPPAAVPPGIDLTTELDPAAAGLGAGAGTDEGHDFVRLARIVEGINPDTFAFGSALAAEDQLLPLSDVDVVAPVDSQPDAVDDSYAVNEDSVLTVTPAGVLGNDSIGGDGGTLAVTSFTQPAHGSLTLNPDGSFSYTPAANFNGSDSFTYTITDADGDTDTATVAITVNAVNDPPMATDNLDSIAEDAGVAASGNMISDNDGFGVDSDVDTGAVLHVSAVSGGDVYGTLTWYADGGYSYALNNANPLVQGLDEGETLTEIYTYTLMDETGLTDTATLTVTITGTPDSADVTVSAEGADAMVYEHGLVIPLPENTETDTGSFQVSATDGIDTVVLGTHSYTLAQILALGSSNQSFTTANGSTLTLTGYSGNAFGGTISFSYTLNTAQTTPGTDISSESIPVTVNGIGGTTDSANLVVDIIDDKPVITFTSDATVWNADTYSTTGTFVAAAGADGFATLVDGAQFTGFTDGADSGYTSGGSTIYYFGVGTDTLTASTDPDGVGGTVFTVTLDENGTYTVDMLGSVDSITDFNVINLGMLGISGGNGAYYVVGSGTAGAAIDDILVTAIPVNGTVNTSNDDIGTNTQWIAPNTGLQFDFVEGIATNGTYSDHRDLTGVSIGLADVKGGTQLTEVIVGFLDINDSDPLKGETSLLTSANWQSFITSISYQTVVGGAVTTITLDSPAEIQAAVTAGTIGFDTDFAVTTTSKGVTYTEYMDGVWIDGVLENTSVNITTSSTFEAVQVANHGGEDFAINGMGGAYLSTEPVDVSLSYVVVDNDGDISLSDTFTITANPVVLGDDGNNVLYGGSGSDLIVGGEGNDIMTGGMGADTFAWGVNDHDTAGTPDLDTVTDFSGALPAAGGDILDLRELLPDAAEGTLTSYLHFEQVGADTVLHVSSTGAYGGGFNAAQDDLRITLENVDLTSIGNDQAIINDLLTKGKLQTD